MRTPRSGSLGTALEPLRAGTAIEAALDREEVFELLLRATRARLGFAALLLVDHDELRCVRVLAEPGFEVAGLDTLVIPRDVPAFETVIATSSPRVGEITTGEPPLDRMLERLAGTASVLVFPICVRMHALALVVAHQGATPFVYADVADLFPLLAVADGALVRVLSARARSAAERAPTRSDSVEYEVELSFAEGHAARRAATVSHREASSWPELAESIRELIRDGVDHGVPGEDEQLELLFELGQIELEHLGRPEAAIEAWRGALAIDAGDVRVLDALEALYAARGRWLDCVELLDKRVAMTEDLGVRITLLLNLAAIAREQLGDPRRAVEAYERIIGWEPGHRVAAPQLEALYRAREEWEPLAAQMLDRASGDSDPRALAALEEVAEMYAHKVGDPRAAALVWLTALRRAPTRARLEHVARLAAMADAWTELVPECITAAEHLEGAHAELAATLWHQVATWSRDELADRAGAVRALERALVLVPAETELASELCAELGALSEAEPAVATAYYERALAGSAEPTALLLALHRLYLASEAWAKIAGLLPRLIDALAPSAPVAVIVELHVELGAVYGDRLDRPDEAVGAYQDALALAPDHALAHRSLVALYERSGQTEAALEAREAEIDSGDAHAGYGELAAAWHEHGRFERAIACWRKLLAHTPGSEAAYDGLARALRADEQWLELVEALRDRISASYDRRAMLELAEVLESRLGDVAGATAALEAAVAREPDELVPLDALARVYERAGRMRLALDALERLLARAPDARVRADLLQRAGQLHLAGRDAAAARLRLEQALALDRENAQAHEAMARVHLQQGELAAAGEELLRAARLHDARTDVIRCVADAAWLYRHRVGDAARARECLHWILELEPEHADAKQALAELLHDNQEWADLWPHLEAEVARAASSESSVDERRAVYTRAARCAVELGKFPRAMELYDLACGLGPDPAIQLERAEALYRSKAIDAAVMSLQTLATDAASLPRAQRIALFRRIAQMLTELGRSAQAAQYHGKVLDLEPGHRETLAELAELHLTGGRYDDAIGCLRELAAPPSVPAAERVALLERIGDLYRHRLGNLGRATSTYLDALELDAANRRVLQRLLELQTSAGQWVRAVETIQRFLSHETEASHRAAYHLAAAEIRRAELHDTAGARADYEHALDELLRDQPLRTATRQRAIHVFQELDALVTTERDWGYLEQAYRRMIARMPDGDPILIALWHALGEHCRTRLGAAERAIQAFEIAHALDPDKAPVRTRLLAQLYAQIGAAAPAIAAAPAAAPRTDAEGYRALARTALAAGRTDEAWCACRALVAIKQATRDEEALYRRYQAQETRIATGVLDDDAWAQVRHPDEDRAISAVLAVVWEGLVTLRAASAKSFELRAKDRVPTEDDPRVLGRSFRYAARTLDVACPEVYLQPRRAGSLMLANCLDKGRLAPAVIVGRDMMTGLRDPEVTAVVAAMVALLRPAYYLKLAMTTAEELEAALAAAARLVDRKLGRPELEPLIEVFVPALEAKLSRAHVETLRPLVARLPDRPDLGRWRGAVDAAAHRASLLVAGELAGAARTLAHAAPRSALIAYSVSPAYFALRQHLGVTIRA